VVTVISVIPLDINILNIEGSKLKEMKIPDIICIRFLNLKIFSLRNQNVFSPLLSEVKCFKCNNFGHKSNECRCMLEYLSKSKNITHLDIKKNKGRWERNPKKGMQCGLAL